MPYLYYGNPDLVPGLQLGWSAGASGATAGWFFRPSEVAAALPRRRRWRRRLNEPPQRENIFLSPHAHCSIPAKTRRDETY